MKKLLAVSVLSLTALGASRASADPAADKLFAQARADREKAHKDREDAWVKLQQAVNEEIAASRLDRAAHLAEAKALGILKADTNKVKAFHDRVQAWRERRRAHRLHMEARNLSVRAAHHRHLAQEIKTAEAD